MMDIYTAIAAGISLFLAILFWMALLENRKQAERTRLYVIATDSLATLAATYVIIAKESFVDLSEADKWYAEEENKKKTIEFKHGLLEFAIKEASKSKEDYTNIKGE